MELRATQAKKRVYDNNPFVVMLDMCARGRDRVKMQFAAKIDWWFSCLANECKAKKRLRKAQIYTTNNRNVSVCLLSHCLGIIYYTIGQVFMYFSTTKSFYKMFAVTTNCMSIGNKEPGDDDLSTEAMPMETIKKIIQRPIPSNFWNCCGCGEGENEERKRPFGSLWRKHCLYLFLRYKPLFKCFCIVNCDEINIILIHIAVVYVHCRNVFDYMDSLLTVLCLLLSLFLYSFQVSSLCLSLCKSNKKSQFIGF